jgi:hypothetical protein
LWVLCLDDQCGRALAKAGLPNVRIISLSEIEAADPAFAQARQSRSLIEYYFTATPVLLLQVLRKTSPGELVTYVDADLYFFGSPAPLFEQLASASCGLVEHRFPPHLEALKSYGLYNVGWVSLRHDEVGLACGEWWRLRCLEWCHDRVESDRFADQKYLDRVPKIFERVRILDHAGANLAPWNLERHRVADCRGELRADGTRVIFFHFHNFRRISRRLWCAGFVKLQTRPSDVVIERIYRPYLEALRLEDERTARAVRKRRAPGRGRGAYLTLREIASPAFALQILTGRQVLFFAGRPLRRRSRTSITTSERATLVLD